VSGSPGAHGPFETRRPPDRRGLAQLARSFSAYGAPLAAALRWIWTHDRAFFVALTALNLWAARGTFRPGIWADNDSVCHYAYLRHLIEEFYPATGTFFGWTPKYNLGAPFLIYNTPPGLYLAAAITSAISRLSPLASLKLVVVASYLSVPLLGAALARTFEDPPGALPKFVGLSLSLFSSELFGLEFYFKNGMLNPAVAVPLALATLLCSRRAQRESGPRALRWLALGALGFGATAFVHLLTAYMLCLTLGCFTFAAGLRRFGRSVVEVATIAGLGTGLVAFWLVPSLPFAAKEDAAYTWIRRPSDTLGGFLDGSIFSSYFVGFYPRFFSFSAVGIVVAICAGAGLSRLAVRRNAAVAACAATAILALLVAMGPRPSFGLSVLPMYDRLLWYRFMTLAELMTLVLAGWGASWLWELRERLGRAFLVVVAGVAFWALTVLTQRADAIMTASAEPAFVADVDAVAAWLRIHGKGDGRVFSEFLAQNVVDSVSVNYPRHMIPILSGLGEASGWIYENDEAAQLFLKRGLLWYDPLPMVALAERFDVQYVLAGSPNLVHALSSDPRWTLALATPHVSLFEAVGREPSLVEADGYRSQIAREGYLRGGGYEYVIRIDPTGAGERARDLLVKTSWSPAWRARSGDRELAVERSEDALVEIVLPTASAPETVTLTWDIGALRARGNHISLVALACAILLFGAGSWPLARLRGVFEVPGRLLHRAGVGAAVAALAAAVARSHSIDKSVVGFGIRGGMLVTFDTKRADVGAFDDTSPSRLTRVLESAWGPRDLAGHAPARTLFGRGATAATLTLSAPGPNRVTVRGQVRDGSGGERSDAPVALLVGAPGRSELACRVNGALGTPIVIPQDCLAGAAGDGPGIRRTVGFEADGALVVTTLDVDDGVVVVEAETMHNSLDDGGYDAFYALGPADEVASNGVSMRAIVGEGMDITLDRDVALPAPRYDAWVLTRTTSARLGKSLARLVLESDERTFADVDPGRASAWPFWDGDPHWEWLPAGRVEGGGTRKIGVTFRRSSGAFDGQADLDAMAFVPAPG
jgi:hypothetical protein